MVAPGDASHGDAASASQHSYYDDDDEDDDSVSDAGMFSFVRPSTAEQPSKPSPFSLAGDAEAASSTTTAAAPAAPEGMPTSRAPRSNWTRPTTTSPTPSYHSELTPCSASPRRAHPGVLPTIPSRDGESEVTVTVELGRQGVHQRAGYREPSTPELKKSLSRRSPRGGEVCSERFDVSVGMHGRGGGGEEPRAPVSRALSNSTLGDAQPDEEYDMGSWKSSRHGGIPLDALHHLSEQPVPGATFALQDVQSDGRLKPPEGGDSASELEEDSPYAEVRASVSNWDDTEIPALTFRSWFLGLVLTSSLGSANTFLAFRYPAPTITPLVALILAYPLGKLLAWCLPIRSWPIPPRLGLGSSISLNPGPFSQKEHAVIVMMANVGITPPYALNFCVATEVYYKIKYSFAFDFLLVSTTSLLGFGVAGLYRRFLVWPASLIWPQNLLLTTLIATFHAEEDNEPDAVGIPRIRMFTYVIAGATAWYWLPGYLFQALSAFSFICWMAPTSKIINQLFGVSSGLGMSLLTFDWSQISFISSPLIMPWWAIANIFFCFVLVDWLLASILYYNNVWSTAYFPISASSVFDRFGHPYNISSILLQQGRRIDEAAYQSYSPLFLPATYACSIGVAFALLPAALVHTAIYHGRDIWSKAKGLQTEREDVHMKLMKQYPEVPDWAYAAFCAVALSIASITTGMWPTETPVWSIIVAFLFGTIFLLPAGFVFAMTTTALQINVPSELLAGFMMKGNPLANMLFKTYALTTTVVGLSFVQDLKLGHYMKVPPRTTFMVQIVAVLVSCLAQVAVKRWLVGNVSDFCQAGQSALLVCPTTRVYYSASIIWGAIGPHRLFGFGRQYSPLLACFAIGAIAPVFTWLLAKRWPKTWLAYISLPVALNGALFAPNANGINYSSWFLVGFVFQYLLRRRHFSTWSKYVYLISAGLDSGTTISALVIFFSLALPKSGHVQLSWWGNDVFKHTLDWRGVSQLVAPPEGFGPTSGW